MLLRFTSICLAALALTGCRAIVGSCHDPAPYESAETAPALEIPPGLDEPNTRNALRIPELTEPPPPSRKPGDPCLDAPPKYSLPQPPEA